MLYVDIYKMKRDEKRERESRIIKTSRIQFRKQNYKTNFLLLFFLINNHNSSRSSSKIGLERLA